MRDWNDGGGSDADLVRQVADGDRDAFATLYRRHHATIFRFARLMTGSTTAAEDIVQEVFLALMRDAARYDPVRASLSTYLYGIARRQTNRRLLRERRFVGIEQVHAKEDVSAGSLDESLNLQNELQRLRTAILGLAPRYREVLVLCDLEDVPYAEAAATLGCPVGTVRSRLHRARTLLSKAMCAQRREGARAEDGRSARVRVRWSI